VRRSKCGGKWGILDHVWFGTVEKITALEKDGADLLYMLLNGNHLYSN
jgi:hypothetical protein